MRHFSTGAAILAAVLLATVLPAVGLISSAPAAAQTPTADQIINSLKPTAPPSTSRGIRQLGPANEPAASPATPASAGIAPAAPRVTPPARATAAPAAPSVNLTVNFASGSADLTPQAIHALDELGRALTSASLAGYRFRIEGHTDTVGTPESNKALSSRRADAVVEYLVGKWKVDRAKLEAAGMGEEQLLVPTGPNVPQPKNRRVTVVNTGA